VQREAERALFDDELGDLGFLYDLGQITKDAYIAQLRGLLSQLDPEADKEAFRQLTLQIQSLEKSTESLSQFNLPGTLDLNGLFYQARRISQFGEFGTSGATAIDNRTVNITLNVNSGNAQEVIDIINDALGGPPTVGFGTGNY
jgi:hypothetical protein